MPTIVCRTSYLHRHHAAPAPGLGGVVALPPFPPEGDPGWSPWEEKIALTVPKVRPPAERTPAAPGGPARRPDLAKLMRQRRGR